MANRLAQNVRSHQKLYQDDQQGDYSLSLVTPI